MATDTTMGHGHDHEQGRDEHRYDHGCTHEPDHGYVTLPNRGRSSDGLVGRIRSLLPFVGGHSHEHDALEGVADRSLFGIAWFAFLLGFAHEEEFEIIALCAGSQYCLELMTAYALTVVAGIVALTLLIIAGYKHYEDRVERLTPYLPVFSAVVLVGIGVGFVVGVF